MYLLLKKKVLVCEQGFTLVETLVAISILLVVIISPMTIAQKGMQNAFYAGDQTTAVYLAQEAIEYMQVFRDDNALAEFSDYQSDGSDGDGDTRRWYSDLDSECTVTIADPDGCDVDLNGASPSFNDCSIASNCQLGIDPTPNDRVYGYGPGFTEDSIYERRIRFGAFNNGGYPVTVTVSWNASIFGNTTRTVVLQTYIYDHYARYE